MFLIIDGGCYWISSSSTYQGGRRQRFIALIVGAPESPSAPVRRVPSMFLCIDGGRSRIFGPASQGGRRRRHATK
jgi:hypothetical protein